MRSFLFGVLLWYFTFGAAALFADDYIPTGDPLDEIEALQCSREHVCWDVIRNKLIWHDRLGWHFFDPKDPRPVEEQMEWIRSPFTERTENNK